MAVTQFQSVAVLRLAALGDICMTVPLLRTLQKNLPDTEIHWIISRNMCSLVEGLSGINFIKLDKPYSISGYKQCYDQLKPYRFDALLVPQASMRSNLLCPLIKAKVKYGYGPLHSRDMQRWFVNRTVIAKKEHLIDSFLRFVEPLGITNKVLEWDLPISEQDKTWAKQQLNSYPGKWLIVCPVASKSERNWFTDRYIELLNRLAQIWQFNIAIVGSPGKTEQEAADSISQAMSVPCINLVGKSNLKQLAAILGEGDVVLAPDTGPLHMAVAMNTPVVGLYAVAPPEKTGPYFSQQWVVNKFPEAVTTILNKDPESVSWRQRVHTQDAMALIQVEDVFIKINSLFAELKFPRKNNN